MPDRSPLPMSAPPASGWYPRWGKRVFDLLLVLPACVVFAPVLLVLAVLVRWRLGSPILFRQLRPGYAGRPFTILKFRTMTDARGSNGQLLSDAERLTHFGKFLRSTSLDELPELWNVLRGEMSLVGPRPLLMKYLPLYNSEQAKRHNGLPGVTGWAQINGRNAISWDQKFALDRWYIEHCSLWVDLRILALTVWKVLRKDGVSAAEHATMPEFSGNATASETRARAA